MSAPHILIVGGGITGLAAAFYLERCVTEGGTPIEITLAERSDRLGGKLGTELHNGFLVDIGPDSFMAQKPWAVELCRDLDMADEVISPRSSQFYMLFDGRLNAVPHELVSLVPSKPEALWKTSFISLAGKVRASSEGLIEPRGDIQDESLSSFMRRRFGDEFAAHFAEPLMGGVHAGDPQQMSMAAIYPSFWEMEKKHGSITRALLERRLAERGSRQPQQTSPFVALRYGMQSLVNRLRERLIRTRILLGTSVDQLTRSKTGAFRGILSSGEEINAGSVILTTPAFAAADLLEQLSADAAEALRDIPYASTAVVTLAYRQEDIKNPLEGTGFLVPRDQGLSITGCTWSSNKWEGRGPAGAVLLRAFMGYAGNDTFIIRETEDELSRLAHNELAKTLGIESDPIFSQVNRWRHSMPQYEVGHLAKVDRLEKDLGHYPGLLLAGSAYRGVGVPDCIRQGKAASEKAVRACAGK